MEKVYVVGYEANDSGAISFWDWYPKKENAENRRIELESNPHCSTGVIYHGEITLPNDVDTKNKEDITAYVEEFLCDNG